MNIAILLATYNGEKFLREQLDSVLAQRCEYPFFVLVRDDGSRDDGTRDIIDEYANIDSRVRVVQGGGGQRGAAKNFDVLMGEAIKEGASHALFCDQDDVWMPHKLDIMTGLMLELEASEGEGTPLLVHSDLVVVDENLKEIAPSFLRYQGLEHEVVDPLGVLLVQNFVTGCATMVNNALLRIVHPMPSEALMHDWWCAQIAAALGKIGHVSQATVLYRQHASNTVGAKSFWSQVSVRLKNRRALEREGVKHFVETVAQAGALSERMNALDRSGSEQVQRRVSDYATLIEKGQFGRVSTAIRLGIRRQGILRRAFFYVMLIRCGRYLG